MTREPPRSVLPLLGDNRGRFKIHIIGNSGEPCHYTFSLLVSSLRQEQGRHVQHDMMNNGHDVSVRVP